MKIKKILAASAFLITSVLSAQTEKLGVDFGVIGGQAFGKKEVGLGKIEEKFGFGFFITPTYQLNEKIQLGLRYSLFKSDLKYTGEDLDQLGNPIPLTKDYGIITHGIAFTGEYGFMPTEEIKPFAGLGLGVFITSPSDDFFKLDDVAVFTISPKVGAEYKNVKFYLAYNIMTSTPKFKGGDEKIYNRSNLEFGLAYSFKLSK